MYFCLVVDLLKKCNFFLYYVLIKASQTIPIVDISDPNSVPIRRFFPKYNDSMTVMLLFDRRNIEIRV